MKDILDAVVAAKTHYQSKRTGSKLQEYPTTFLERVCFYSTIMDFIVQRHPKYVSLALEAMKLLFNVGKSFRFTKCFDG